jgi:hypothetical protein
MDRGSIGLRDPIVDRGKPSVQQYLPLCKHHISYKKINAYITSRNLTDEILISAASDAYIP